MPTLSPQPKTLLSAFGESLWTCQANSHFLGMETLPKPPLLLGSNLLMHYTHTATEHEK